MYKNEEEKEKGGCMKRVTDEKYGKYLVHTDI